MRRSCLRESQSKGAPVRRVEVEAMVTHSTEAKLTCRDWVDWVDLPVRREVDCSRARICSKIWLRQVTAA